MTITPQNKLLVATIGLAILASLAQIYEIVLPILVFVSAVLVLIIFFRLRTLLRDISDKLVKIQRVNESLYVSDQNNIRADIEELKLALDDQVYTLEKKIDKTEANAYQQLESREKLKELLTSIQFSSIESLRGWAIAPDTAVLLYQLAQSRNDSDVSIVEMGSGSSTLVFASAISNGSKQGHVYSLEHDVDYAKKTRENIKSAGLDALATVIEAPIAQVSVEKKQRYWFSEESLTHLPDKIDILFIDSPPKSTDALARYPALPLLYDRLSDDAVIVLDDYAREDETEIVKLWMKKYPEMRLEKRKQTDHGTAILRRVVN